MAAQDIEYIELYASDMTSAVDYFVSSFGFTRVAEYAGETVVHVSFAESGSTLRDQL